MKRIALIFFVSIILFSCEKDYLIPNREVPKWLKTQIIQDEQKIKDNPSLCLNYGGWLRYEWQNEYYFEYHCSCSSSSPKLLTEKGKPLYISVWDKNTDYYKEKCCKQYVWKAPNYKEWEY
jgi:hypothetical protein